MATRALIGHLDKDKKFVSTYNHYDGNPDGLGKTLEKFFNTDEKARVVSNTGYISSIDPDSGEIESKYKEKANTEILDEDAFEAGLQIGREVDAYAGNYGYVWFNDKWNSVKNNGVESMAMQLEDILGESGMFRVDESKIIDKNIMEQGYEAKWAKFLNEAKEMDFSVIKKFIQDDLQRGDQEDPALDAYIESLQRDFAAGRDSDYSDYEMDDYVEDFQNYEADKMDS